MGAALRLFCENQAAFSPPEHGRIVTSSPLDAEYIGIDPARVGTAGDGVYLEVGRRVGTDFRSTCCKSHPRPTSRNRTIRDRHHSVETGCAQKSSHEGSEWPVLVKRQETLNA